MSELLPCPFCGAHDAYDALTSTNWHQLECNGCGARGPCIGIGEFEAKRDWNTRPTMPVSEPGGWQPIETAPKDGTPIIGGFHSIRWADSHRKNDIVRCWWQPEFEAFVSSCREMCLHNGHTFEDGSTRQLHSPVKEPVTHWMPLPPAPEAQP